MGVDGLTASHVRGTPHTIDSLVETPKCVCTGAWNKAPVGTPAPVWGGSSQARENGTGTTAPPRGGDHTPAVTGTGPGDGPQHGHPMCGAHRTSPTAAAVPNLWTLVLCGHEGGFPLAPPRPAAPLPGWPLLGWGGTRSPRSVHALRAAAGVRAP